MTANSYRLRMESICNATHHRESKYDKISIRGNFVRHLGISLNFRFACPGVAHLHRATVSLSTCTSERRARRGPPPRRLAVRGQMAKMDRHDRSRVPHSRMAMSQRKDLARTPA